jgi:hypothetical protein
MKLIRRDLEIHEGPGEHTDLRNEPYVRFWAGCQKQSLDRAQGSVETADQVIEA